MKSGWQKRRNVRMFLVIFAIATALGFLSTASIPSIRGNAVSSALEGPIVVTVTTDKGSYAVGEPIKFTLTARNTSASSVPANGGAQEYDFAVRDASGTDVWRWSAARAFIAIYRYGNLAPGEVKTFTETWDQKRNDGQPIPVGTYRVFGTYTIDPAIDAAPFQFTVGQATGTPSATASPSVTPTATATSVPPADTSAQWFDRPPASAGAAKSCPGKGQWLLLYWGGADATAISSAANTCFTIALRIFPAQYICADGTRTPNQDDCAEADLFWVSRGGRWLGFAKSAPDASDSWDVVKGEAHFVHGK